jgi:integrase/recombinase XerD
MLLKDLLNEYLFHIQTKNYSPRTQKGYKNNNKAFLKYIEQEFDVTELEDVKSLHIKQYGLF